MIKTVNFPCECQILHYTTTAEELKIKLPFISFDDDDFWDSASDKTYKELTFSVRENDQWGYEEIVSKLIYEEEKSTTLWILVYDIHFSVYRIWCVINTNDKDYKTFTEFCRKLNLNKANVHN